MTVHPEGESLEQAHGGPHVSIEYLEFFSSMMGPAPERIFVMAHEDQRRRLENMLREYDLLGDVTVYYSRHLAPGTIRRIPPPPDFKFGRHPGPIL